MRKGVKWPTTFMAVLAAALLAAGVLRHYWDIYTHRTVRGISFIFVGIDAAGDLFSLISICKQDSHIHPFICHIAKSANLLYILICYSQQSFSLHMMSLE